MNKARMNEIHEDKSKERLSKFFNAIYIDF